VIAQARLQVGRETLVLGDVGSCLHPVLRDRNREVAALTLPAFDSGRRGYGL